jgi:hypothetical protein
VHRRAGGVGVMGCATTATPRAITATVRLATTVIPTMRRAGASTARVSTVGEDGVFAGGPGVDGAAGSCSPRSSRGRDVTDDAPSHSLSTASHCNRTTRDADRCVAVLADLLGTSRESRRTPPRRVSPATRETRRPLGGNHENSLRIAPKCPAAPPNGTLTRSKPT